MAASRIGDGSQGRCARRRCAGVSRSAGMKMTGHLTETVYRRYAIVSESDLQEAAIKLATLHATEGSTAAKPKVVELR